MAGTAAPGRANPHRHHGRIDIPTEGGGSCRAAQISRFTKRVQRKIIKSSSEQIGGTARITVWLPGDPP